MPTTLRDFRARYPQYNDMTDDDLTARLHAKYYSDLPLDVFKARFNPGSQAAQAQAEPEPQTGGFDSIEEIGKSLTRGALLGKSAALEAAGRFYEPSGRMDYYGAISDIALSKSDTDEELRERAAQVYQEAQAPELAKAKDAPPVRGFITGTIAEMIPYMSATMGASALGTLAGGPAVGAAAAWKVGSAVEGNDHYQSTKQQMIENGVPEAEAEKQARMEGEIVGAVSGAIEAMQVSDIIRFTGGSEGKAVRAFLNALKRRAGRKAIAKAGKKAGAKQLELSAREAVEESLQELTSQGVGFVGHDGSFNIGAIGKSALAGGGAGLFFGFGGSTAMAGTRGLQTRARAKGIKEARGRRLQDDILKARQAEIDAEMDEIIAKERKGEAKKARTKAVEDHTRLYRAWERAETGSDQEADLRRQVYDKARQINEIDGIEDPQEAITDDTGQVVYPAIGRGFKPPEVSHLETILAKKETRQVQRAEPPTEQPSEPSGLPTVEQPFVPQAEPAEAPQPEPAPPKTPRPGPIRKQSQARDLLASYAYAPRTPADIFSDISRMDRQSLRQVDQYIKKNPHTLPKDILPTVRDHIRETLDKIEFDSAIQALQKAAAAKMARRKVKVKDAEGKTHTETRLTSPEYEKAAKRLNALQLPTYEELLARVHQGDQAAADQLQDGRYREMIPDIVQELAKSPTQPPGPGAVPAKPQPPQTPPTTPATPAPPTVTPTVTEPPPAKPQAKAKKKKKKTKSQKRKERAKKAAATRRANAERLPRQVGVSKEEYDKQIQDTKERINSHDLVAQVREELGRRVERGLYLVSKGEWADLKAREDLNLLKNFTPQKSRSKLGWDQYAVSIGREGMSFDEFVDELSDVIHGNADRTALKEAAKGDPYLQSLAMKLAMLQAGESKQKINDALATAAARYDADASDLFIDEGKNGRTSDSIRKSAREAMGKVDEPSKTKEEQKALDDALAAQDLFLNGPPPGAEVAGPTTPETETGIFGQEEVVESTSGEQIPLGLEARSVQPDRVDYKHDLVKAIRQVRATNKKRKWTAKQIAQALADQPDLFIDNKNRIKEVQTAMADDEFGQSLFDPREKGAAPLVGDMAEGMVQYLHKAGDTGTALLEAARTVIKSGLSKGAWYTARLGPAGKKIARQLHDIAFAFQQHVGTDHADIRLAHKGLTKQERINANKLMNNRIEADAVSAKSRAAMPKLREITDRARDEADSLGIKRKVNGKLISLLGGKGEAYPHVLNRKGMKIMREAEKQGRSSQRVLEWAEKQKAAGRFDTVDEAILAMQEFYRGQLAGDNPYFTRQRLELEDDWIEWDGAKTLPKLVERNWMTVEGVRMWGHEPVNEAGLFGDVTKTDQTKVEFPRLERQLVDVQREAGIEEAERVRKYISVAFGVQTGATKWARDLSRIMKGFQFTTKVGSSILSIGHNMLDRIPKGMMISPLNALRVGLKEYPAFFNRWMKSAQKIEDEMLRRGIVFGHGAVSEGFEADSMVGDILKAPFTASERGNQVFIAQVGYHKVMSDLNRLAQIDKGHISRIFKPLNAVFGRGEKAVRIRLGEQLAAKVDAGQEITQQDINRYLHELVRDRAFPKILTTKEIWYDNHPLLTTIKQFKTWPIEQAKMLGKDVVLYTAKTGDFSRITGMVAGTLVAGEIYNLAKDLIRGTAKSVTKQALKDDDEEKRIGQAILNDLRDGGLYAILSDFTYGARDLLAGVSFQTAAHLAESAEHIARTKGKMTVPALNKLLMQEFTTARQVKNIATRISEGEDQAGRAEAYIQTRNLAFDFKDKEETPGVTGFLTRTAEDIWQGRIKYARTERTLAYEMAARHISAGDVEQAAEMIAYAISTEDNRRDGVSNVKQSRTAKSPLGPLNEKQKMAFLRSLPEKSRRNAVKADRHFLRQYRQAIKLALAKSRQRK